MTAPIFEDAIADDLEEELSEEPTVSLIGIYDEVETHENCTVQILKNSITGQISIGWWDNE